jgi:hypothetical protein
LYGPTSKKLKNASPHSCGRSTEAKQAADRYTAADCGFTAAIGGRQYEARGITRRGNQLKDTVKGIVTEKGKQRIHPDTVDFYSARSRALLVKGLCDRMHRRLKMGSYFES